MKIQGVIATDEEAKRFADTLAPKEAGATIIALSGELGAGKTTFAQALASELGVDEEVTSPTFVIERIYELAPEMGRGFERLIHIDAYRLKSTKELEAIGWHEIVADPENLIVLEWSERVTELVPKNAIGIRLTYVDEESRDITYDKN